MAVAVELLGHLKIRRAVWRRRPEDHLTTKGQGLGGRMGADYRLQTRLFIASQGHLESNRNGHSPAPYDKGEMSQHDMTMPPILHLVQTGIYWRRIYEMDI